MAADRHEDIFTMSCRGRSEVSRIEDCKLKLIRGSIFDPFDNVEDPWSFMSHRLESDAQGDKSPSPKQSSQIVEHVVDADDEGDDKTDSDSEMNSTSCGSGLATDDDDFHQEDTDGSDSGERVRLEWAFVEKVKPTVADVVLEGTVSAQWPPTASTSGLSRALLPGPAASRAVAEVPDGTVFARSEHAASTLSCPLRCAPRSETRLSL